MALFLLQHGKAGYLIVSLLAVDIVNYAHDMFNEWSIANSVNETLTSYIHSQNMGTLIIDYWLHVKDSFSMVTCSPYVRYCVAETKDVFEEDVVIILLKVVKRLLLLCE